MTKNEKRQELQSIMKLLDCWSNDEEWIAALAQGLHRLITLLLHETE